MMCPKCGKILEGDIVRCPDCGVELEVQYAPPRVEPGPSKLLQYQPTVVPKNVPVGKARLSSGWWIGVGVLAAIMLAALVFAILARSNIL